VTVQTDASVSEAAMAEATAHLLSAYKNLEILTAVSSPYAALLPTEEAVRFLCGAIVALEECCVTVWMRGEAPHRSSGRGVHVTANAAPCDS
jgi:hypothetical protein